MTYITSKRSNYKLLHFFYGWKGQPLKRHINNLYSDMKESNRKYLFACFVQLNRQVLFRISRYFNKWKLKVLNEVDTKDTRKYIKLTKSQTPEREHAISKIAMTLDKLQEIKKNKMRVIQNSFELWRAKAYFLAKREIQKNIKLMNMVSKYIYINIYIYIYVVYYNGIKLQISITFSLESDNNFSFAQNK